jgi:putative nucleotidyltransferase with HDIG domain
MSGSSAVLASDSDIAQQAFASAEWRSAADSIFQATGVSVLVMDFEAGTSLSASPCCAHCYLASEIGQPEPGVCFDKLPKSDSGPARLTCRAGLPTLVAPVVHDGRCVAHVLVSGFVTSTRDRRRLWEMLAARGVREDSVRLAVKSITVISRAEAEGYLQVAAACARTVVQATAERMSTQARVNELRVFLTAGQQIVTSENLDATTLSGIAEEAVAFIGGEAGAVLRPSAHFFEVVARTEKWRGAIGALIPRGDTASGRAASTRRTVVAKSGRGTSATLSLPLAIGSRVLGVLEVRLPGSALPLEPERVARLDRFGRFIASAIEREDERAQAARSMAGYTQLNSLAASLGGASDLDAAVKLVSTVIENTFDYTLAGVVLSSWGRDQADVSLAGEASQAEIDSVLGEVAGRDLAEAPFGAVNVNERGGRVVDTAPAEDEWALASVDLEHGDLVIGYLFVARADGGRYTATDRALLEGIASHAGAAFGRVALYTRIRDDYAKTIAALSATLDAGEHMPSGHSNRVMEYAMMIGEELKLAFEDVEQLRFAGLLHDIGKSGLPSELLLKPSKLSAEELARVRAHAELGASIVDQIEFLKSLTPIILHHHEHWDGSGYPNGLAAEKIPLLSRILAVADAFDAMTSKRAFRKKLTFAQARKELREQAGIQFDPRVVDALNEALEKAALAGATGLLAPKETHGRPELPA